MQSDVYHSYCHSLLELTSNSKTIIEYLTDLASKNKGHADQIVEAIVQRTFDSKNEAQLSHLYLIDSIMKKIGEPFNSLLFPMIFDLFMFSFQHASDSIRICLFKLFISWKLILPEDILTNIILTASNLDSHWPLQSFSDFKDANLLKYFPEPEVNNVINEKRDRKTQDIISCKDAVDKQKHLQRLQDDKSNIMRNLESLKRKRDECSQLLINDDIRHVKTRAQVDNRHPNKNINENFKNTPILSDINPPYQSNYNNFDDKHQNYYYTGGEHNFKRKYPHENFAYPYGTEKHETSRCNFSEPRPQGYLNEPPARNRHRPPNVHPSIMKQPPSQFNSYYAPPFIDSNVYDRYNNVAYHSSSNRGSSEYHLGSFHDRARDNKNQLNKQKKIATEPLIASEPKQSILEVFNQFVQKASTSKKAPSPGFVLETPELTDPLNVATNIKLLRMRNEQLIVSFYSGTQCSSCGLRFNENDKERYRSHLDLHFYRNLKKGKNTYNWRAYYWDLERWLNLDELNDASSKNSIPNSPTISKDSHEIPIDRKLETISVKAKTPNEDICSACYEKLTVFWNNEAGEWHHDNAILADSKFYHNLCFELSKTTTQNDKNKNTKDTYK